MTKKPDGVISSINGYCAIWDTLKVLGVLNYNAMRVVCWEGEWLVCCITMTDIFDLLPGIELTWFKRPIQVSVDTKVWGCVINVLFVWPMSNDSVFVCLFLYDRNRYYYCIFSSVYICFYYTLWM